MKRYLTLVALMFITLTACEHKDLCENHREHAHRYHINVVADYRYDWEECCGGPNWLEEWPEHYINYDELRPSHPSGLRVVAYDKDGDYNIHNINADGGVVSLYEGFNDLLFYNNDTEYIIFSRTGDGVTTRVTTRATTRASTRASYKGSPFANSNEPTLTPPDMLYANYFTDYLAEKVIDPVDVEVTLYPLVYTYKIRYEFESGLEYVAMARGVLTGMASSVSLNTGETSEDPASLLFDCALVEYGARAFVNSFGTPGYPNPNFGTRADNKHSLNLELLLRNGKTITYDYDVTDQVRIQPHGGVVVISGIVISEEDGTHGSGGWDVSVDDWGEYEDVPLPL